jgi:hypothetical protein
MKATELDKKFDENKEASLIGVTRQSIIKMWLVERLEAQRANKRHRSDI